MTAEHLAISRPCPAVWSVDNQVIILWCAQAGKICRLKDQVNIRNRLTFLSKHLTDSYEVWKNLDFVINSVKNSDWRCRSGFGSSADLDLPRIWNSGLNPLAEMAPPFADLDPPPPHHTFFLKHPLYHIGYLILFASFLSMFFSITTQHSSIKVKEKTSHFVPILPHLL